MKKQQKHKNILLDPSLKDLKTWIEIQAKDYLDNELGIDYEEFFFSESWININGKGGDQKVHNHSNAIISGTYYLKSLDGHPPLDFHKVKSENESISNRMLRLSGQFASHPRRRNMRQHLSVQRRVF